MSSESKILHPRTDNETDSASHQLAQRLDALPVSGHSQIDVEGSREARRRQWIRYLMEAYGVAANR